MSTILTRRFFTREAETVARALLGTRLVCGSHAGIVVETEAYLGPNDLASHARFTSSTRNRVMAEVGGTAYVYLCYGIHHLFNVVTGHAGDLQAVLIRSLAEPSDPLSRRMSGPGKLSKALGIGLAHNALDLTATNSCLRFERGQRIATSQVVQGPRIGVAYAGDWANKPLRFSIAGHRAVSVQTSI